MRAATDTDSGFTLHAMLAVALLTALLFATACENREAFLEPEDAGLDFVVQGEYASEGQGAQVIALGDGAFRLVRLAGGLPGAGWDGETRVEIEGSRQGDDVAFADGSRIRAGVLALATQGGGPAARLDRLLRESPTLGAPPPPSALVLFDGTLDELEGEVDPRGLLVAGATSRRAFGDALLHVEFRTPFMPGATGQARGNSGVYLQNRYEVQVLDSFGLSGEWNECGGLYKVRKPTVNMAFPPLSWQTYDIDFTAPRFDEAGRKIASARISVFHNGVAIHEDVELPDETGGGDDESAEPGPLHLQDHWDPVFFRNVWIVER